MHEVSHAIDREEKEERRIHTREGEAGLATERASEAASKSILFVQGNDGGHDWSSVLVI